MVCPICTGSYLSDDVSVAEKEGRKVVLQGKIHCIINHNEAYYPPFSDYLTVSLYPRKGRVKYLKFKTQDEFKKWGFIREKRIRCEGCLHEVDGREIIFDITKVIFL